MERFFLKIAPLCSCPGLDDDDNDADMMIIEMFSPQKCPAVQLPWLGLPQQDTETSSNYLRGLSPHTGVISGEIIVKSWSHCFKGSFCLLELKETGFSQHIFVIQSVYYYWEPQKLYFTNQSKNTVYMYQVREPYSAVQYLAERIDIASLLGLPHRSPPDQVDHYT